MISPTDIEEIQEAFDQAWETVDDYIEGDEPRAFFDRLRNDKWCQDVLMALCANFSQFYVGQILKKRRRPH